jgi:hypothetical protein
MQECENDAGRAGRATATGEMHECRNAGMQECEDKAGRARMAEQAIVDEGCDQASAGRILRTASRNAVMSGCASPRRADRSGW